MKLTTQEQYAPLPKGWTRSATHDLVQMILGPLARTWQRKNGRVQIGYERGKQKVILGDGESWEAVFRQVFIQPLAARERLREVMREDLEAARAKRREALTELTQASEEAGDYFGPGTTAEGARS